MTNTGPARERFASLTRWLPFAIALVTILAFLPVLRADFVSWDDDSNFLNNPYYRGLGWTQLRWMWTTFHMGHYVPLTWMTLGADFALWRMNPAGYHATSLALHAANAVLLSFVALCILRLAKPEADAVRIGAAAAFATLFFALHPLRVESVAWITERRDVLSLFFYLSALLCYLRGTQAAGTGGRWYWLSLAAFGCALLSKGTSVTLPAILLILNVYPLRRLGGAAGWWTTHARRVYVELLPFVLLSVAASALSIVALDPGRQLTMGGKVAVSAYGVAFYLWKTVAPVHLAPLYGMPKTVDPFAARFVLGYVVVISLSVAAWLGRRRAPGAAVAWLAFLTILLPMLGIVQNGPQIAADRYTYHASPALAVAAGAGVLFLSRRALVAAAAGGAVVFLALGALTWRQTYVWRDSERLWNRVLEVDAESSLAHTALANWLVRHDRVEEAVDHYERVLVLDPASGEADNNLGVAFVRQGRLADAVEQYRKAIAKQPAHYEAHNNLGTTYAQLGDLDRAIEQYREALAIKPDFGYAHVNWGNALVRLGRHDDAIEHYRQAVALRESDIDAHLNWGVALAQQGKLDDAVQHFVRVLDIDPNHADARAYLDRATAARRAAP